MSDELNSREADSIQMQTSRDELHAVRTFAERAYPSSTGEDLVPTSLRGDTESWMDGTFGTIHIVGKTLDEDGNVLHTEVNEGETSSVVILKDQQTAYDVAVTVMSMLFTKEQYDYLTGLMYQFGTQNMESGTKSLLNEKLDARLAEQTGEPSSNLPPEVAKMLQAMGVDVSRAAIFEVTPENADELGKLLGKDESKEDEN